MKRSMFAIVILVAIAMAAGQSAQARCDTWNAASADQHHVVDGGAAYVDVVGGHGYGSAWHDDAHKSPPKPPGAYGDPQRRAAEGGYVQGGTADHMVNFRADFFGPLDETNNSQIYDTSGGACVSVAGTDVDTGEQYIPTAQ